jgi:hypothetical protein
MIKPALELFSTAALGERVSAISIGVGASAGSSSARPVDDPRHGTAASVIIVARASAVCISSGGLANWIGSGARYKAALGAGTEGQTALGVAEGNTALGEGVHGSKGCGEGSQGNTAVGTGVLTRSADRLKEEKVAEAGVGALYRVASGDTSNAIDAKPKQSSQSTNRNLS